MAALLLSVTVPDLLPLLPPRELAPPGLMLSMLSAYRLLPRALRSRSDASLAGVTGSTVGLTAAKDECRRLLDAPSPNVRGWLLLWLELRSMTGLSLIR